MEFSSKGASIICDNHRKLLNITFSRPHPYHSWGMVRIPYEHIVNIESKRTFGTRPEAIVHLKITDKDRVRSMHPTDARRLLLGHKVPFFFKNKKAREDFVQQVNPLVQAHQNDELRQWVHPMIKAADRERARQQELTSDGRRKPAFNPDNLNLSPAEDLRHIQYQFGGLKLGYKFIHYEGNSFPISGSRATIDTGAAAQSRVSLTRVVGGSLFGPTGALIGALAKKNSGNIFLNIETAGGDYLVAVGPAREAKVAGNIVSYINSRTQTRG